MKINLNIYFVIIIIQLFFISNASDKNKLNNHTNNTLNRGNAVKLKELEEKILSKDWDALNIVDLIDDQKQVVELLKEFLKKIPSFSDLLMRKGPKVIKKKIRDNSQLCS